MSDRAAFEKFYADEFDMSAESMIRFADGYADCQQQTHWNAWQAARADAKSAEPVDRNRAARNPGGMECERCGCIFIGEEWHNLCGVCVAIPPSERGDWQSRYAAPPSATPADGNTHLENDVPLDPMDWPLPCDVTVGHGTMRKGVKLRTLVARMQALFDIAHANDGPQRSIADLIAPSAEPARVTEDCTGRKCQREPCEWPECVHTAAKPAFVPWRTQFERAAAERDILARENAEIKALHADAIEAIKDEAERANIAERENAELRAKLTDGPLPPARTEARELSDDELAALVREAAVLTGDRTEARADEREEYAKVDRLWKEAAIRADRAETTCRGLERAGEILLAENVALLVERDKYRECLTKLVEALHTGRTDTQRLIDEWRSAELWLRMCEDAPASASSAPPEPQK